MANGTLGMLSTPAEGRSPAHAAAWAADSGVFGVGYPGDDGYLAWLSKHAGSAATCLFATCPDVVCDHQRTYRRSDSWPDRIRALGYRPAFVAQNGARPWSIDWHRYSALFIGGDTGWKLGLQAAELAREAKSRGLWVHMGRVNSGVRYGYAESIGCDSADGTFLAFGPDQNLPRLLAWSRSPRQEVFC